ncbi:MAG: hypothetical protein JRN66_06980 [Nitrososphaerota archaeon]|nr:hypothetical protein [Nitrososphaerota archaeon]
MYIYIRENGDITYALSNGGQAFFSNLSLKTGITAFLMKNYPTDLVRKQPTSQYNSEETFIQATVDEKTYQIIRKLDEVSPLIQYDWETKVTNTSETANKTITQDTLKNIIFKNINTPERLAMDAKHILDMKTTYDRVLETLIKNKPATAKVNTIVFTITPHRFRSMKLGFIDLNVVGERFKCSFTYARLDSPSDLWQLLTPPHRTLGRLLDPFWDNYVGRKHYLNMMVNHGAKFESEGVLVTPKQRRKYDGNLRDAVAAAVAHDMPLTSILSLTN